MSDATSALISVMERNHLQAQQNEEQRATLTTIIVVIASAIQGLLTQTGFKTSSLPLTVTLILLGIYGAVATLKLYERYKFHADRCEYLRKRLDELQPDAEIMKSIKIADDEHNARFPILSNRIKLHILWEALHIMIAILGIVYTLIILLK